MHTHSRPILFMLASTFSLSLNGLLSKFLAQEFSIISLSVLRFTLPAIIIFSFLSFSKLSVPNKSMKKALLARSASIAASQVCFLFALNHLSLVESIVLFSTGPLFIPLLERVLFKVKVQKTAIIGLFLTFTGVILMAGDVSGITLKPELLLGLGAGFFNGCAQVSLYRATKGNLTPIELNGWSFMLASIFLLPLFLVKGVPASDIGVFIYPAENIVVLLAVFGLSATVINTQYFRASAYKLVKSNSQLAPLIFTNLIFTAIWQRLFFAESYSGLQSAGLTLIVIASLMQIFAGKLRLGSGTGDVAHR